MEQGNIEKNTVMVNIEDEMRGAYLDYAMSVIVGRALPDVRDGLKPVHRRVLYAMYDLGNSYNKAYKKSARVVGDVIGKYHPHGDTAVYDTIVRMAQDFSLRYPLIDGQGNFGSIDGDSAAAMRYTEIRMARITDEVLADIDKETVDSGPNYDDSLQEPLVMPAKIPNLLINGTSGIAVGMATNIPPHNLGEVCDAVAALARNPKLSIDELSEYVKGPDFPTGGYICGTGGIKAAYRTGKGVIQTRAKTKIETSKKGGKEAIIVTELPYYVNKARLIEKIAELVRDKRIEGVSDLRDESDRTGMRIVIELRKGENSQVVLNRLFKLTQMQERFGITMLALNHKQPKIFNLKEMLHAFIEHRREIVVRRTIYDLKKAEARAHILEGLKKAVENIDAVIALIKAAKGPDEAREGLMARYSFSELQAQAILDMRLQRLTGLERDKIVQEYKDTLALIERLKTILGSDKLVLDIIVDETEEIKKTYGDKRRTEILEEAAEDIADEDLIADEEMIVAITNTGYVKRSSPSIYRSQRRGGKGVKGITTGEEDFVTTMFRTTMLSYLLCFTDKGRVHWLKVYRIPEGSRAFKGKAIVNLLSLATGENIKAILPVREFREDQFVVMVTRKGVIKKTNLAEYSNVRNMGITAMSFDPGDELAAAKLTSGKHHVFICSKSGMSIRFDEADARAMGRTARGTRGMDLESGDEVVGVEVLDPEVAKGITILTVTTLGYGKRTEPEEYRIQSRGGKGIITMRTIDKTGVVMGTKAVTDKDDLMIITNKGQTLRTKIAEIRETGRVAQGVKLINLNEAESVVGIELLAENGDEDEGCAPTDSGNGNGAPAESGGMNALGDSSGPTVH
ncbi:MAG: DNA gyrase subunit A [Deltaproteobacteria bacterium]|nr:DNA gyrase subunit A [Deltaproteobacteria bacterium]